MPLQFFHVEDLCRFIEILLKIQPTQKVFNVGNNPITIKEWVEICYAAMGKTPKFINVTADIEQRNYFPFYDYGYALDTTLQNEIVPDLIPLPVGFQRSYNWYKDNKSTVKPKNYFDFIERNF